MVEANTKVQKEKEETAENEIRVAVVGKVSSYLGYAFRILNKSEHRSLTIRATGNAIVKALILIELVKRRIGELHQLNTIHSMTIVDDYKPKVDGQDDETVEKVKQVRRVTALNCELSKDPLDENKVGYQKPEPKEERVQLPPRKRDGNRGGGANKGKKTFNKEDQVDKDAPEKSTPKGKNNDKDGTTTKHRGAHGKKGKRYNYEDNAHGDEQKGKSKEVDKEKYQKADRRDDRQHNRDHSPDNNERSRAPYGGERGRRGRGAARGGAGFVPGRGRGMRGGMQRRYNDDFDIQSSKRPKDQLDSRPHQSRDPRNSQNMKDHPQRGPINQPINQHAQVRRGMRGSRGTFGPPHGPPPHRRDRDDRDQGAAIGNHRHRDSGFEILEPQRSRGGNTGMRGGARGAPSDRQPMKSFDDFNVAPRGYHEKDDLVEQEHHSGAPRGRQGGFYDQRERDQGYYHRNVQEERFARPHYYNGPPGYYNYDPRDEPHGMRGGRGGHRGMEQDYYRYGQNRYNQGYDYQYNRQERYGEMGPPRRYFEQDSGNSYRGRDQRYGNQGEQRLDGERPPNAGRGMRGRGGSNYFQADHDRHHDRESEYQGSYRGGQGERGGMRGRGRRGGHGPPGNMGGEDQGSQGYGANKNDTGSGTRNNNNDDDQTMNNRHGGSNRGRDNRYQENIQTLAIIDGNSRSRGSMRGRGDMRMRGGADSSQPDEFRPDFRGGYGDRGMRGRGMRGNRGGMDSMRDGMQEGRDISENIFDTQMNNGAMRGGRGAPLMNESDE